MNRKIVFAVLLGSMIPVVLGAAGGDDTVISTQAATAAQTQAFEANAASIGIGALIKAKIIVANGKMCQGKFKKEGGPTNTSTSNGKTFFKNNGTQFEGIILSEDYLNTTASDQILTTYQEIRRACFGFLRVPPPSGGLIGQVDPKCAPIVNGAHKLANSAIGAAQDAANRSEMASLTKPPGINQDEWDKSQAASCLQAQSAINDAVRLKQQYDLGMQIQKGLNFGAPPAEPTAVQAYLIFARARMCRSITRARKLLQGANK